MSESTIVLPGLGTVTLEVKDKVFKSGKDGFFGVQETTLKGKKVKVQVLGFVK